MDPHVENGKGHICVLLSMDEQWYLLGLQVIHKTKQPWPTSWPLQTSICPLFGNRESVCSIGKTTPDMWLTSADTVVI